MVVNLRHSIPFATAPAFEWPNASNTGSSGTLTPDTGPYSINTDNLVIQNKSTTVGWYITGSNVTIRNCHIDCSFEESWWGIDILASGTIVEDCTIIGPLTFIGQGAINGSGTFRRNNISRWSNGIMLNGSAQITRNYIHDLGAPLWTNSTAYVVGNKARDFAVGNYWQCAVAHTSSSSGTFEAHRNANPSHWTFIDLHVDGIQLTGESPGTLIEENYILSEDTSCVIIKGDFGPIDDVTVNHNYCAAFPAEGVGYGILVAEGLGGNCTNITVTNNQIEPCGFDELAINTGNEEIFSSGNVDAITGDPIDF